MFGRGKRDRERGRRAAAEAVALLNDALDHELKVRSGREPGDPARYGVVPMVERLLRISGNDPNNVLVVMQSWWKPYDGKLDEDEQRSTAATAIFLGVGLNGVGNLFGFVPSDAPSFDPELAAEGRARGWRR